MTDRAANGRFAPGNKASPGRPPKAREENFNALIDAAVSDEDWTEIITMACRQAKRGDGMAREYLTNRRWGKVKEQIDANLSGTLTFVWSPHKPKPA